MLSLCFIFTECVLSSKKESTPPDLPSPITNQVTEDVILRCEESETTKRHTPKVRTPGKYQVVPTTSFIF